MPDLVAYLAKLEAGLARAVARLQQATQAADRARADANAAAGAVQAVRRLVDGETETPSIPGGVGDDPPASDGERESG